MVLVFGKNDVTTKDNPPLPASDIDDISVFEANTSDVTMQMMSHESDAEEGEKSALLRRRYPEVPATLDDVTSDDDVSDCDINCLLIVEENETV